MLLLTLLGLSERLEVQEMFEHLQEEKLDTLQGELVTCIEGEEGQGGRDNNILINKTLNKLRLSWAKL